MCQGWGCADKSHWALGRRPGPIADKSLKRAVRGRDDSTRYATATAEYLGPAEIHTNAFEKESVDELTAFARHEREHFEGLYFSSACATSDFSQPHAHMQGRTYKRQSGHAMRSVSPKASWTSCRGDLQTMIDKKRSLQLEWTPITPSCEPSIFHTSRARVLLVVFVCLVRVLSFTYLVDSCVGISTPRPPQA